MNKRIAVLPGDGIGPEVTNQSIKVLDAIAARFGHSFDYHFAVVGAIAIDQTGNPLPETTIDTCLSSDAVLFGAIGDPKYDNDPSATVRPEQGLLKLRKVLELYTNIRPIDTYKALHHLSPVKARLLENVDFVIFRELTGGIYFGKKEKSVDGNSAMDECTYSKYEIERITHLAFQYAQKRKNKLTLIDKANVLETSRLWRSVVQELAASYPTVAVDYMYVDNAAMQVILNPAQFDVVLTENMFGDIISDEASVLAGSLGLLPSASVGNKAALFEPIHGSYPQAAGKDIANPIGSILSAAMLLDHFGLPAEALAVRKAVEWTLLNGFVSKDIDPVNNYSTSAIGDLIADHIERNNELVVSANTSLNKSTII
ncbi:MAG: 3-isopropylmalate dehydrogenase [Sediminibacterium sp.]|jgi:3-isopropylmalate dehydrogenase|uniref:3-isopropylmalate dehydrogenase n=1 Tax=Sediminibacterium sp. TaxID=1917865 RepID=UPI002ABBAF0F|nr:3-isopropylmalate dehydrogenase [Sediminibacterium sp.]MDZ4072167.1 3-isopropylmalate dehydrogenase [Sediminibacterium sp.]